MTDSNMVQSVSLLNSPPCTMTPTELHDETHLKVLRLLQGTPRMNQREVSEALGIMSKTQSDRPD